MKHNVFITSCLFFLITIGSPVYSKEKQKPTQTELENNQKQEQIPSVTINTGSFLFHLDRPSNPDGYTEFFENEFFSLGIKLNQRSYFHAGSFLNSFGDRGILLGYRREWYSFSPRFRFEGLYAYTGEFFFDAFKNFGDHGVYSEFKRIFGWGWAPYIYQGIEYDVFKHLSLEAGYIIGNLIVASIQWNIFL